MRFRRLTLLSITCAVFCSGMAALALRDPGSTACALAGWSGREPLADGTLVDAGSPASEQARVLALLDAARVRIRDTFGAPRARPVILFFNDPQAFWPLRLNTYGSTSFVGSRACVLIGPKGQDVDVVAHELMHAELFDRVGFWGRFTEVPVWFDEGVAMQVDLRQRYDVPEGEPVDTAYVRRLERASQFAVSDDRQLTRHYAAAKAEVSRWLQEIGPQGLYARFERLHAGEPFSQVLAK